MHQAISTGATQVEETRKQFAETEEQLRRELEDERRRLREQKEHLEAVQAYMTGIEDMVKDMLSPEFDRVKRWAAIKMDLRKYTWKNYVNRPVMLSLG